MSENTFSLNLKTVNQIAQKTGHSIKNMWPSRIPLILIPPVLIITLSLAVPLIYLVIRLLQTDASIWNLLLRQQTLQALLNTLLLSGAVTISSIIIAVPLAWLTVRIDFPGRKLFSILTIVPLVIPSLIGGFTFISAFGRGGFIHQLLQWLNINFVPDIYGFGGAWILLTLLCYPYVLLTVRSALMNMDQSQIEAARTMGLNPLKTFFKVTLPKLKPAVTAGGLLIALYTISDFAAVSLLQYNTFTRLIYIEYQTSFNRIYAAVLALLLVMMSLIIVSLEMKNQNNNHYYSVGAGTKRHLMKITPGKWKWLGTGFCSLVVLFSLILPAGTIIYWIFRGLRQGEELIIRPEAAFNSFYVSFLAAILTVSSALPIALVSTHYKSKFSGFIQNIAYAGYALPGIVVALSLVFFGANYGRLFYQTLPLLLFAYVILFLPQALGTLRSSLLQLNPHIEDAGLIIGFSRMQILHKIILPLLKPGILSGAALVFLTSMKELPATMLLGPIGFRSLTTEIWNATIEAFYTRAAVPALILIIISSFSLAIIFKRKEDTEQKCQLQES